MTKTIFQIQIELNESQPKIWRRLLVPSDILLSNLHDAIQVAMGWSDSHLHQFIKNKEYYGLPSDDGLDDFPINDYRKIKLGSFLKKEKDSCIYEYDFGDSWEHKIVLEKILPLDETNIYPRCIDGKRHCPPEDCGGVWGYSAMLKILKQPDHEEYESYMEWLDDEFDAEHFDMDEVNRKLAYYFRPSKTKR